MIDINTYLVVFFTTLLIDGTWLGLSNQIYLKMYHKLLGKKPIFNLFSAFLAYIVLALGMTYFVVKPNLKQTDTDLLTSAAIYGLVVYGVYNFTNHATLRGWESNVLIMDLIWGIVGSCLVAYVSKLIITNFKIT